MSQPQRFICTVDPSKDGFLVCTSEPARVQVQPTKVQSTKLQVRKLQAVNPQPSVLPTPEPTNGIACAEQVVFSQNDIVNLQTAPGNSVTKGVAGASGVTITIHSIDGTYFDFSAQNSSAVAVAVITDAYVVNFLRDERNHYAYAAPVSADDNISAPVGEDPTCPSAASSLVFCVQLVTITKTVVATYDSKCDRTVSISPLYPSITMGYDAECPITTKGKFNVSWVGIEEFSNYYVSGVITITNNGLTPVTVVSIIDALDGGAPLAVSPGGETLAGGASLDYDYEFTNFPVPPDVNAGGENVAVLIYEQANTEYSVSTTQAYTWTPNVIACAAQIDITFTGEVTPGSVSIPVDAADCSGSSSACVEIGPYDAAGSFSVDATATLTGLCQSLPSIASASIAVNVVDP